MRFIEHLKRHDNFDSYVVLMDELGYTDTEITTKLEISKQRIYDARRRLEPLLEALNGIGDPKPLTYGNPDVTAIVEAFKEAFGTTTVSQYDRYAAKRLATKHGTKAIIIVIQLLANRGGDKFAPSVNNVLELEKKWVSIVRFLHNQQQEETIDL